MTVVPQTEAGLQEAVRTNRRVIATGAGTKSAGTVAAGGMTAVSTRLWRGIVDYSPDECVFTARSGTPLSEIAATLASRGQYLPFDPPLAGAGATLGGTVAAGLNGPGRYRYGGVRDFIIGARVIDGDGGLIRSGGRVVKNAAGFLLHHGIVGSAGRLGVISEMTFKVFPRPEARRTLRIECGTVAAALAAARRVEALRCDCEAIDFDERGTLRVRIAGRARAIDARAARLAAALGGAAADAIELPRNIDLLAPLAADGLDCVRVAALAARWADLQPHVQRAYFMCAGAMAWLWSSALEALDAAMASAHLSGVVITGPAAGRRLGHFPINPFEERVRRVLDPHDRFSAAPHSGR